MTRILKYPLKEDPVEVIHLPRDAEILSVQYQREILCLWVMGANPEVESRIIEIYGTGQDTKADKTKGGMLKYLATVQNDQQDRVWHVFERVSIVY